MLLVFQRDRYRHIRQLPFMVITFLFSLLGQNKHTLFCLLRMTWSEVMGSSRTGAGPYTIGYIFYVLWAIIFASLAACLVRMFAPYGEFCLSLNFNVAQGN